MTGWELPAALLPTVVFGTGLYFGLKLAKFLIFRPGKILRGLFPRAGERGTSPYRALCVALGGTLGVGNIVGVSAAVLTGGAGAVFWMLAAAFFAMPLKYAEVTLALSDRRCDNSGRMHGGTPYIWERALPGRAGRVIGCIFAVFCLGSMVALGCVLQSHATVEAFRGVFGIPAFVTGGIFMLLAAAVLFRGADRVEAVCARLIPVLCLLFTVLSVSVLVVRRAFLPLAISSIFKGAFTKNGCVGGAIGILTSSAVRAGVARGLVSNEAGCGTAPMAHAAAGNVEPAAQGILGIFEVFLDTTVLCTLTALCLLVSGAGGENEMDFVLNSYGSVLGKIAPPLLAVSIACFSFATVLAWSHYGAECLYYLSGKEKAARAVVPVAAISVLVGAFSAPTVIWGVTDFFLCGMTILNCAVLIFRQKTVVEQTKNYFTEGEWKKRGEARLRRKASPLCLPKSNR